MRDGDHVAEVHRDVRVDVAGGRRPRVLAVGASAQITAVQPCFEADAVLLQALGLRAVAAIRENVGEGALGGLPQGGVEAVPAGAGVRAVLAMGVALAVLLQALGHAAAAGDGGAGVHCRPLSWSEKLGK